MKLISHRGNINGRKVYENEPEYLDMAIARGFDVEIDIWLINNELFLGHDKPVYPILLKWLVDREKKLWIHCKNLDALVYFTENNHNLEYFWHENDTVTLTSKGNIWAYPNKQPIKNSIAVLPELYNDDISGCMGVCSDYVLKYEKYGKEV